MTDKCPICHSEIETWSDDPLLTPRGLAGDEYKGFIFIKANHIIELQEERKQQEIDYGIPEADRTVFTEITPNTEFISKKVIEELRESTEKILTLGEEVTEVERTELLKEYFNYDEDGIYIGTYKYGEKVADKEEWTDVNPDNKPKLPDDIVKMKAIHIEDLRHPLFLWRETWNSADLFDEEVILDYGEYNPYGYQGLQSIKYLFSDEGEYRNVDADQIWKFFGYVQNGFYIIGHPGGNTNSYGQLKVEIKNPEDKLLKISSNIDTPFHGGYLYYHYNEAKSQFNSNLITKSPNLSVIRNSKNLYLNINEFSGSINKEVEWNYVEGWIYWNKLRKDYYEEQQSWSGNTVTWNWTEEQLEDIGRAYASFGFQIIFSDSKVLSYLYSAQDLSDAPANTIPISPGDIERNLVQDYTNAYGSPSPTLKVADINIYTYLYGYSFRNVKQGWYDSYINMIYPTLTQVGRATASVDIQINNIKFKYKD